MTGRRRAWAIAAASLAMLFVSTSSALASPGCRSWDFQNQTFYVNQSNGYVVRITLGQATYEGARIKFSKNGQINIERQGGVGSFPLSPQFGRNTGSLVFAINWRPPDDRPNDTNVGTYIGEPANIRRNQDGSLIADLEGYTTGDSITERDLLERVLQPTQIGTKYTPKRAGALWSTPARIFCRPGDVLPDGVTAKEQDQARQDAAAAAPPPTPLGATGRARPSGPSVAHILAFQGGWQTVTDQNGHYTLVLQIANPGQYPLGDLHVTGQFINTDGATQYNGVLQGVIPRGTRTLNYTYSQPEMKTGGQGQFNLSNDGNAITGTGTAGGQTFAWNGTRAN